MYAWMLASMMSVDTLAGEIFPFIADLHQGVAKRSSPSVTDWI
jgi:hypothetical protein